MKKDKPEESQQETQEQYERGKTTGGRLTVANRHKQAEANEKESE